MRDEPDLGLCISIVVPGRPWHLCSYAHLPSRAISPAPSSTLQIMKVSWRSFLVRSGLNRKSLASSSTSPVHSKMPAEVASSLIKRHLGSVRWISLTINSHPADNVGSEAIAVVYVAKTKADGDGNGRGKSIACTQSPGHPAHSSRKWNRG